MALFARSRATPGIARRYDPLTDIVAVLLALAGGWMLGHSIGCTHRAAVWGALATLLLTCAMGGPVPIARDVRAFGIWLAVLPACVVALPQGRKRREM